MGRVQPTIVFAFFAGIAIERLIIRPMQRRPVIAIVIVFIGLLVIVNSIAGWIFGTPSRPSPSRSRSASYGNRYISTHEVGHRSS